MEDWKIRLKAEYSQLKERYEKLKAYNTKLEAETLSGKISKPEDIHSKMLLKRQQTTMGEYLHILELRAALAEIDLLKEE